MRTAVRTASNDCEPVYIDLKDVPLSPHNVQSGTWKKRLDGLTYGKAGMVSYNNRQRAHDVRQSITHAARYLGIPINTRIIHGTPEIHGTDKWFVYFWNKEVNNGTV